MTTTVGTGSREARAAPPVPPTTAQPRLEQAERRRQLPQALTTEHFTLQTTRSELRRRPTPSPSSLWAWGGIIRSSGVQG
jgi:hypothetical protein